MENLFSYGTLQLESVQQETFGRKLIGEKDILTGYVLSSIRIKDVSVLKISGKDIHPILKYTGKNSDIVEGTIFEITPLELLKADEYEVEDYAREEGTFSSGKIAWVYASAKK